MTITTPALTANDWVSNTNAPSGTPETKTQDQLTSKDTFLKLLIAQIKNQDPMSPSDPTQFVAQLTQYSELEQLVQINQGVESLTAKDPASETSST